MSPTGIRFLGPDMIDQIVALRKEAFQKYYGDSVNLTGLEWNLTDSHSHHVGFFEHGELLSCLRISFFKNVEKLETATQFKMPIGFEIPIVLLARAATKSTSLSLNLHNKLRGVALEFCLRQKWTTIFGSLEDRANRKQQLLNLGYEIVGLQKTWANSYLRNSGDVILVALVGENKIAGALEKLKEKYPWSASAMEWPSEIKII